MNSSTLSCRRTPSSRINIRSQCVRDMFITSGDYLISGRYVSEVPYTLISKKLRLMVRKESLIPRNMFTRILILF
jgi:hypothetical protein